MSRYCAQGHLLTPETVYVRPDSGKHICRTCKSIDNMRQYEVRRERLALERAEFQARDKHGPELVRVPVAGWGCKL